jgi:hypothetical protein
MTSAHFPKFMLSPQRLPLTNFGKSWALPNFLILMPLFHLKFLNGASRL